MRELRICAFAHWVDVDVPRPDGRGSLIDVNGSRPDVSGLC